MATAAAQEFHQHQNRADETSANSNNCNGSQTSIATSKAQRRHKPIDHKWWLRITTYTIFVLVGQTAAILLGRLYYAKGGKSKWMATFVQSAGFPAIIPLYLYFLNKEKTSTPPPTSTVPSLPKLALLYLVLGLIMAGDNMMYSLGLLYIPVSTYSLICATQLAFNALFSFFLNNQKFTALIFNSLVLLSISAALLAINADSENSSTFSKSKYPIGFLCTLGASAIFSFYLSIFQLCLDKVMKRETLSTVLKMIIYPQFVATFACLVGIFASGDWKGLSKEMRGYEKGRVSYIMTLVWIALTWAIASLGMFGLIFEVSSLFSNVINTLALPLVPVFAVVFFHDSMGGVKVIALLLALWGFLSYIYQHYLDDAKAKKGNAMANEDHAAVQIC